MKKFIVRLLTFLLLLSLIYSSAITGVIFLNKRALKNCSLGGDYHTVIVGDSHTMWSIDDSQLEGARNVSLNAEGFEYTYRKLKQILENNQGIKQVYVGFSYHNLSDYYNDYIFGEQFLYFMGRYLPILKVEDYQRVFANDSRNLITMVQQTGKSGWKPGLKGECNIYGSFPELPMTDVFRSDSVERRVASQYYDGADIRGVSNANITSLVKLIELSRSHAVEPIMLNTPLHPAYEDKVPRYYRNLYRDILEKYNLTEYSFSDLSLNDEHFLPDGDHTNYQGSIKTTEYFREYLNAN